MEGCAREVRHGIASSASWVGLTAQQRYGQCFLRCKIVGHNRYHRIVIRRLAGMDRS